MDSFPILPLDQIPHLLDGLPQPDDNAYAAARAHQDQLTKPQGALGRLEEIALWLARWQGHTKPQIDNMQVHVFAGNHGVTAQGISAFPSDVTVQMVANYERGGAAINQLCKAFDADLQITPLNLDDPTADFTQGPAMSADDAAEAFAIGASRLQSPVDLIVIGEMGIGNTTAAAAICYALFGGRPEDWIGRGTGLDDDGLARKARVLQQAIDLHKPAFNSNPLNILQFVGGRELAAMAGLIFAARQLNVPVLLDGYVCGAAAAPLYCLAPTLLDHCMAAHVSAEPGHHRLLAQLKMDPLLNLGMRLGEASGAATALGLVKAAVATHNGMATFADAQVSNKENP